MKNIKTAIILILVIGLFFVLAKAAAAADAGQATNVTAPSSLNPFTNQEKEETAEESAQEESAPKEKTVKMLEVKGALTISTATIIAKIKTRPGDIYTTNTANEDIKKIYAMGFFSDVSNEVIDYEDGVKVTFFVKEKPVIRKIIFQGRLITKEELLAKQLKSKEAQYLDHPTLKEDIATLKKLYEKRGHPQALINYKVNIDESINKADVIFTIELGQRIRIRKITIQGNREFKTSRILRLMKTKRAWLFSRGFLKTEVLDEDLERIRTFYRHEGFQDVDCNYKIDYDKKYLNRMYITISIQEGKKYTVANVSVTGNKELSTQNIYKQITECLPGKIFSHEGIQKDIASIQGFYFGKGYLFVSVKESVHINPDTAKVDIKYSIVENQIAYVNKIIIRGNTRTKDVVIRRELRINPGERFDGDKLKRSKERLINLGYFEEVNYDTESTDEPDKRDLIVEVKETKTGEFSFGGGYSSVDQFIGFVEIAQKNFDWQNWPTFVGAGQDLRLRAEIGTIRNSLELSFTEPWIFGHPVSFGFDGYRRTHTRESDVGYAFDEKRTGGDLRLGKELSDYLRINGMYRLESVDISNVVDDATQDLKDELGNNLISSGEVSLTRDTRDNVFNPNKGTILFGSAELAGGPFGGDKDFTKFFGRASYFLPIPKIFNGVVELKLRAGLADAFSNTSKVPIYERFYAGGSETIRGYEERSIGPIDAKTEDPIGGEALLVGNIEYVFPIMEFLKGAVFFDTGNVWAKANDFGKGNFKSGMGFGIRVKTPIGPLKLDYGIPLSTAPGEEEKKGGKFHFGMGYNY